MPDSGFNKKKQNITNKNCFREANIAEQGGSMTRNETLEANCLRFSSYWLGIDWVARNETYATFLSKTRPKWPPHSSKLENMPSNPLALAYTVHLYSLTTTAPSSWSVQSVVYNYTTQLQFPPRSLTVLLPSATSTPTLWFKPNPT